MELANVRMEEVLEATDKLNSKPRKCLGYKMPYEIFKKHTGINLKNYSSKYAVMH